MRWHILFWLLLFMAVSGESDSRGVSQMTGVGSAGGTALGSCGTGVIDLSAGCTLPIMLGLVP